jgi:hypothetical protein
VFFRLFSSRIIIFFVYLNLLQSVVRSELGLFRHNRNNATHLLCILAVLWDPIWKWYFVFNFHHVCALFACSRWFQVYRWSSFNMIFLLIHFLNFYPKFKIFKVCIWIILEFHLIWIEGGALVLRYRLFFDLINFFFLL